MRKILIVSLLAAGAIVLATVVQADDQFAAEAGQVKFVTCPRSISTSHCTPTSFQFEAVNVHNEKPNHGIRYHLVSGPGAIDERTGWWTIDPTTMNIREWGQRFKVTVAAAQGHGKLTDTCSFTVRVYNYAPRPFLPGPHHKDSIPVTAGIDNVIPVWWVDRDSCDTIQKQVTALPPVPSGALYLNDAGNLVFHPLMSDTGMSFMVRLTADDGINSNSLDLRLIVGSPVVRPSQYTLRIEKVHDVLQGQIQNVSVFLEMASSDTLTGGLGGFDLLIGHDASALSLQAVFTDTSSVHQKCNWEYFTYRFGAVDSIPGGQPSGYVRVVGIAETNNGPIHPTCTPKYVPALPAKLCTMRFLISNDRTLECTSVPIRFYWRDCDDNSLVGWKGQQWHVANRVFEFEGFNMSDTGVLIDPTFATLPGTSGLPLDTCVDGVPGRLLPLRDVDLYHGGLDIVCADSIDARGDINLNGLAYELSDCVMFSNYFIYGLNAFQGHVQGSTEASDVNGDGVPLTLLDYVSLERVIIGQPLPDPPPDTHMIMISVNPGESGGCILTTSDTLGALYLVVDGEVVPELLVPDAFMKYAIESDTTRILISGDCSKLAKVGAGAVVRIGGSGAPMCRIVYLDAAPYWGTRAPVEVNFPTDVNNGVSQNLPLTFALRQNYPNPFNAGTVISFDLPEAADVLLEVVNVTGQLVHEVNRHFTAGSHEIAWDATTGGRAVASGVYYYRITAGEFTATRKMVLLK